MTNLSPLEIAHAAIPGYNDAQRALAALSAHRKAAGAAQTAPVPDLRAEVIGALLAGDPVPADLGARAYETQLSAASDRAAADVLYGVESTLKNRAAAAVRSGADDGLRALKPLLASVVERARALAPRVARAPSAEAAVVADPATLAAYQQFGGCLSEYQAIRAAQRAVTGRSDECIGVTPIGELLRVSGEISNLDQVHPDWRPDTNSQRLTEPPWPDYTPSDLLRVQHTRAYLLWLVSHPVAEPWVPTRSELAANFEEQGRARYQRSHPDSPAVLGKAPHARRVAAGGPSSAVVGSHVVDFTNLPA